MEELGGLLSMGRKESDMTEQLHFNFLLSLVQTLKRLPAM